MNVPCLRQYGVHLGIVVFFLITKKRKPRGTRGHFRVPLAVFEALGQKDDGQEAHCNPDGARHFET